MQREVGDFPIGDVGSTSSFNLQPSSFSAPLAAAALVAFNDMFIQYSRAVLTDVPVCLWMTLAVGKAKSFSTGLAT